MMLHASCSKLIEHIITQSSVVVETGKADPSSRNVSKTTLPLFCGKTVYTTRLFIFTTSHIHTCGTHTITIVSLLFTEIIFDHTDRVVDDVWLQVCQSCARVPGS